MTPRGSASSAAESTMDTTTFNTSSKKRNHHHTTTTTTQEEGHETEVWSTFNHSFKQVQSVLDRNRVLIQQVNDNHQSKVPDNMAKNHQRNKNSDGERDSGED